MKKIVFFGGKIQSSFNTIIPIIKELLKNEVEVYYFGYREFKDRIEELGVKFYKYRNLNHEVVSSETRNIIEADDLVRKYVDVFDRLFSLGKICKDNEIDKIRELKPDLIFRDNDAIQGLYVARELKIPSVGINCMPYISEKYMKMNPLKNYMAYYGISSVNIKDIKKNFYKDIEDKIKVLCIEKDLPYINQSYLVSGCDDINICFGGKSINKIIGDEKRVKIVKPMTKKVLETIKENDDDLIRMLESDKPLIYMASGLMINFPNEYYNCVINSVIKSDYNLIISIPDMESYNDDLPNNIIIRNNVSQEKMLKKAELFLTAGGYNSICEAIAFEVPMIVKPLIFDQNLNAIIIDELDIGINLNSTKISKEFISLQISNIINNKKYKNNIKKVNEEIKSMEDLDGVIIELIK